MTNSFQMRQKNGIKFLVCEPLEKIGFPHAFGTRIGGISPLPSQDLNLAYINDKKENVDENRKRFISALNIGINKIVTVKQIHSDKAVYVNNDFQPNNPEPEADSLYSNRTDILLGVKTADCLPLFLADPHTGYFASVHAGWRGSVKEVAKKTLFRLIKEVGVQEKNCWATFGPTACGQCYEIEEDVYQIFRKGFSYADRIIKKSQENQKYLLDLVEFNKEQLIEAGIPSNQIISSGYCTMHQNDLFFSHRIEGAKSGGRVGRLLSVIGRIHF
ncbi:hypothetical protein BVX98_06395 [bacterium F11]|nr:hypothetical protein BVX98_06395 [bacterium F11]